MKMLSYAPTVEAYVKTEDGRILDLSEDILSCNVRRVADGASTASITLANKKNKYNRVMKPMDRVVIFARKFQRVQLFAGYVDTAPYLTTWNKTVSIGCTDTIKLLQRLYWDASMWESQLLYNGFRADESSEGSRDVGMAQAAIQILTQVANWDPNKIFVTDIPESFFTWAKETAASASETELAQAQAQKFNDLLGVGYSGTASGSTSGIPSSIPPAMAPIVKAAAEQYNLDPCLLCGLIKTESGWNPTAVSGANAHGLTQIVPRWHPEIVDFFPPSAGWKDPARSIPEGARILADYIRSQGGSVLNGLRQYNGGGNYAGIFATLTYANKVLAAQEAYKREVASAGSTGAADTPTVGDNSPSDLAERTAGEEFVKEARRYIGVPYVWGGMSMSGIDCTGLTSMVAKAIAPNDAANMPRHSSDQWDWFQRNGRSFKQASQIEAGDFLYFCADGTGHVHHAAIAVSNTRMIEAQTSGTNVMESNIAGRGFVGGGRLTGTAMSSGSVSGVAGNAMNPLQAAFWMQNTAPIDQVNSFSFRGQKSYINDEPVWDKVHELLNASMRSVSTAPDGSIIAWFPDKFGIHDRTPYFQIEDIELKDINITLNDENFFTHVYVAGASGQGGGVSTLEWINTPGAVSIDMEGIIEAVMNIPTEDAAKYTPEYIYQRYGLRPKQFSMPSIVNDSLMPFMLAMFKFMEYWSTQYKTEATCTFMPELWPGGRVRFASTGIEMYVEEVSHSMSYEGGFETNVEFSCATGADGMVRNGNDMDPNL